MNPISVLLVDDDPAFLRIATRFLWEHDDVVVVGTAGGSEKILNRLSLACYHASQTAFLDFERSSSMTPTHQDLEARRPFIINLSLKQLTQALRRQLTPTANQDTPVIWSDGDSEIIVYPSQLRISLQPGLVLIKLPVATDQTGKDSLVVPFSVGKSPDDATLVALTESVPRGNPLLASRWGYPVQEALWQTLLQVGQGELVKRPVAANMTLSGLFANEMELAYVVTRPFTATEISDYYDAISPEDPPPSPPEPVPEPDVLTGCLLFLINVLRRILGLLYRLLANRG